ncbi:MAG: RNA-binding transcriptional accessory protein [Ruminococcaceae bacterium]|nr:RNA-binding transcriptional accessory protein [Oscillospiraceae bacterium]
MDIIKTLAEELKLTEDQVTKTVALMDEGNTIPFIARYRKEVTGSLDDITLRALEDRLNYLRKLDERRAEISAAIEGQGKLTPEITDALSKAVTLVELEDIYRPYKQKKKTRASVAKEKGLEPLALLIFEQNDTYAGTLEELAAPYIDEEKGVTSAEEALAGASDIIAENISDVAEYRKELRDFAFSFGVITTKQAKDEDSVYADYYDYREEIKKLRPHRVLAITRGEREEFLRVSLELDRDTALSKISSHVITNPKSPVCEFISRALADSYDRLIFPSVEREVRSELFDNASEGALKVFSDNLRKLLLAAPLKGKTVLGYDPGYRTGCKLAVVDKTGKVLDTAVIYPTKPREETEKSRKVVANLIKKYGVDVIAIGNGTASRESEQFIADSIHELGFDTKYTIVSEAGASVYSASKLGAEEFPDFDVTERSAVSIARRLQDPLAELVKIDPKAIGVGQYQHDMKQARLTEALDGVVEDCVNSVGVDINTASHSLLSHISGINATAAKNIVTYREENGEFTSRAQILKVPKIGAKAFEQCAGFLRVSGSNEILDNTGVHPESYAIAKSLLSTFGYTEEDVKSGNISALRAKATIRGTAKLSEELGCGEPTLLDIIGELEKPGRDIRDSLPPPCLRTDVLDIKDLKPDMLLKGTVRNVVDFGAFVDIGVHYDGLLHISEMSDKYIKHPSEMVSVGDVIEVRIKSVDLTKNRIALSCKNMVVVE